MLPEASPAAKFVVDHAKAIGVFLENTLNSTRSLTNGFRSWGRILFLPVRAPHVPHEADADDRGSEVPEKGLTR